MSAREIGVIYVAVGHKYVREAEVSIRSLRRHMPSLPVAIFTNDRVDLMAQATVEPVPQDITPKSLKKFCMLRSPFTYTLYLDADTFICGSVLELFDLLLHFDIATTVSPERITTPNPKIPSCFPEVNGGVILYKSSARIKRFISLWQWHYEKGASAEKRDEPSLRHALYFSRVRHASLLPEYNMRIDYPHCLNGKVKILHGRCSEGLDAIRKQVNACRGYRSYTPVLKGSSRIFEIMEAAE